MAEVLIHEVGFRDGLQMEHQTVPFETKLAWIERMFASGVDIVQVGSFVHPTRVPQMADTDRLFAEIRARATRPGRVTLSGLVLNEKGLERGLACGVQLICLGVSASETHSRKNTGMSIGEATARIIMIARDAEAAGVKVQLSVQSAFGCGYEGPVPRERVLGIIRRYLEAGFRNLSLADTAGHAHPEAVEEIYTSLFALDRDITAACHFHNTYGMALANCVAARRSGVHSFESSVAGLGGCPFTKIAGGNTCTEDLVHYLQRANLRRDIDLSVLNNLASDVAAFFGREMTGMIYKTGGIPEFHQPEGTTA
jgi:hydroxymethylglutaryl-CoA lyase